MKALDMIYFNSLRKYKPVFSVGRTEKNSLTFLIFDIRVEFLLKIFPFLSGFYLLVQII